MVVEKPENIGKPVREIGTGKIGVIKGFYGYFGKKTKAVVKVLFENETSTIACFGDTLEIIEQN